MFLSVIVPVYKTENYLPCCIESILSQSCSDLELILVDDGSPDGCPAICDSFAEKDPRVRVIHQDNSGVVRARNRGLDAASGDYVCFVDSDDAAAPQFAEVLQSMAREAPQPPDVLLYGFKTLFKDREELSVPHAAAGFYDRKAIRSDIHPYYISDRRNGKWWEPGIPVYLFCKAFRRDFLLEHRFTDESVAISEDAAQNFESIFSAGSLCVTHEALYLYDRTNPDSVTRRYRADLPDMFSGLFRYLKQTVGGRYPEIDRQLKEYFAYRILRVINMEAEHKKPIAEASKRLRGDFERTGLLDYADGADIPPPAKFLLGLMRRNLFFPALLALRGFNKYKELKG